MKFNLAMTMLLQRWPFNIDKDFKCCNYYNVYVQLGYSIAQ